MGALHDGFFTDGQGWYARIVRNHAFDTRLSLEEDPSRKQVIPYVVISDGNAIFVTARKSTQNEARLHGKLSIGVGGHINEDDVRAENDAIRAGMMRELHEELRIVCDTDPRFCGFINDDSNPVGRVHLGAVFFVIAQAGSVSVNETEKMDGASGCPGTHSMANATGLRPGQTLCSTRRSVDG
ncbi:MAG: phosphoesterase [bacterium]